MLAGASLRIIWQNTHSDIRVIPSSGLKVGIALIEFLQSIVLYGYFS